MFLARVQLTEAHGITSVCSVSIHNASRRDAIQSETDVAVEYAIKADAIDDLRGT